MYRKLQPQNSYSIACPTHMVWFRYKIVNTAHKGDDDDDCYAAARTPLHQQLTYKLKEHSIS
jgi:hypothetical protein